MRKPFIMILVALGFLASLAGGTSFRSASKNRAETRKPTELPIAFGERDLLITQQENSPAPSHEGNREGDGTLPAPFREEMPESARQRLDYLFSHKPGKSSPGSEPFVHLVSTREAFITDDDYQLLVSLEGIEYQHADGFIRFSRGTASGIRKVSDRKLELVHPDGVIEVLEAKNKVVEQSFVFSTPQEGPIVLEGKLSSDLPAISDPRPGAGINFMKEGKAALGYRKAVAIDAGGDELDLAINFDEATGLVRMTIPESWLALATYPVVLDPTIGPPSILSYFVAQDNSVTRRHFADAAYNPTANTSMVVTQDYYPVPTLTLLRVDGFGALIGNPFNLDYDGLHPQVAFLPQASEYLVAWELDSVIMGRRFNATGDPQGAAFQIGDIPAGEDASPTISPGNNGWLVAWNHSTNTIYGQFVSPSGALSGAPINISGTGMVFGGNGDHEPPQVAFASGIFLAVSRSAANTSRYVGYRVNEATGTILGSEIDIAIGQFTRAPVVAARTDGANPKFLVAYMNFHLSWPDWHCGVEGRFVGIDGTVDQTPLEWTTTGTSTPEVYHIVLGLDYSPAADQFLLAVTYEADVNIPNEYELQVCRIHSDSGNILGAPETILTQMEFEGEPVVVAGENKEYLIYSRRAPFSELVSIRYDANTAPVVTINSHNTQSTNDPGLVLTGHAWAQSGQVTSLTWRNETTGASGACVWTTQIMWEATNLDLLPGNNVITVTAVDDSGETGEASVVVSFSPLSGVLGVSQGDDDSSGGGCGATAVRGDLTGVSGVFLLLLAALGLFCVRRSPV